MKTLLVNRRILLAFLLLVPFFDVKACGPDFRPDVFVRPMNPDDAASYSRGELALLQPTFYRRDLIVAYRYLTGGKLSAVEQRAYFSGPGEVLTEEQSQSERQKEEAAEPTNEWAVERAKYLPTVKNKQSDADGQNRPFPNPGDEWRYDGNFLNCPDNAFQTAVLTLQSRAKTFGNPSPLLANWVAGQDAVFSNCTGNAAAMPLPAGAASPALLRADRAYQIAAAMFYAGEYEDARKQFEAIAQDSSSPWQIYGGYLAARAVVRQATLGKVLPSSNGQASVDPVVLREAQHRLEGLLRDPSQAKMHHAVEAELNFVRLRTEPTKRVQELANALTGPKADADFNQDLIDLTFILDQGLDETALRGDTASYASGTNTPLQRSEAYLQAKGLRSAAQPDSHLIDWLLTFQSPSEDAHEHAIEQWKQTKALPWLTVAISKATAKDAEALALLAAAAEVAQTSPAAMTVSFHRARLLIALNRDDEARALLDAELPALKKSKLDSASNAFLGLRMQTARTLPEFLTFAQRKLLERNSQAWDSVACQSYSSEPKSLDCDAPQLDADSASVLNFQFSVDLLTQAAKAPELPEKLRQSIAIIAWVRSVLLEDANAAKQLAPLLPKEMRQIAGDSVGFPATLAMLRNPGVQPFFDAGIQRSLSYGVLDNYRDNWWCGNWSSTWNNGGAFGTPSQAPVVAVTFLTGSQKAAAKGELQRLLGSSGSVDVSLGQRASELADSGAIYLGQRVLEYAKAHPEDPNVPEALHLTVRAMHFGCGSDTTEARRLATAKAAFQLLHRRYENSWWAKKTKVYS